MKKLLSLLVCFVFATMHAQTSGQISYALDFSSDDPNMAMAIPMMQGSTMDLYFIPEKTKINMNMGTFMKMETVIDTKANKGLLLMEIMGSKTATELKDLSSEDADKTDKTKIETTTETKKIIGYTCTKTILRDDKGNETILWITPEIKASLKGQKQFGTAALNGTPLEFSAKNKGMNIHFTATKFEKTADPKIFSLVIPPGYKTMTEEELQKMGMGQ